jgi:predicted GH43/DUF377 family glycosyl hydrolase
MGYHLSVFTRSELNPILTADDLPFEANVVFNPGAARLRDGRVGLLTRVEDRCGLSSLHLAASTDGVTNWTVEKAALLAPQPTDRWCQWGFEDARVSFVPELDEYVITCTAYGPPGPCVYLATSPDLYSLNSGHVVIPPEDKNAALFPRRIDGSWLLLHRPVVMASNSADIWVSRSEDLISWRDPQPVLLRRSGGWWDAARVGIAPPPIETSEGWLQIYHGVRNTVSGAIYRVGASLLDLEEPWVVRRRTDRWLLSPRDPWERTGDVSNVVFPCGTICHDDGRIDLYYGAADTVVCMATAQLSDLLDLLLNGGTT